MTKVELIELEKNNETINNYKITIDDLINKSNRSLLTGYTEDLLLNWHVYIKEGKIYAFLYGSNCKPCQIDIKENLEYVKDKILILPGCDYEFCKLLKYFNIQFDFNQNLFSKIMPINNYYGKIF